MLQFLFIGLKLASIINWAWWVVLLPLIFYGILSLIISFFARRIYKEIKEKEAKSKPIGQSKWAIKLEEMQKMQAERLKNKNSNSISSVGEAMHDHTFKKGTNNWPN